MRLLYISVLISLVPVKTFAQSDEASRTLQIAQTLEQSGDWQRASVLYEQLFSTDSSNYVYFDALRRAYSQLKEYEKVIRLIRYRLQIRPAEVYLAAYLGGAYVDMGQRVIADSVWSALLTSAPTQRQLYVIVAQQMQERRLFGRAIETFRQGRDAIGNKAEFSQELALLYSATQSYGEAVSEYLRLLEQTPHQLGFVQSRIASFTIRDEGLREADRVVSAAVAEKPSNVQFRMLLAWVLMEQGRYSDALVAYRDLDRLTSSAGTQLFTFAETAMREKEYAAAFQAYNDIIRMSPSSPVRPNALFGMAQAFEAMMPGGGRRTVRSSGELQPAPEGYPAVDSAEAFFQNVVDQYPGTQPALQAMFRIGMIRHERRFDLDGAQRAFAAVRQDPRAGTLSWEALLMEADVLISKGDLPGARALLLSTPPQGRSYLQDRLALKQARIEYLLGSFEQAQVILRGIAASINRDAANDALSLLYFVQEGAADSASLAQYVRGELLGYQRKFAEALELFRAAGRSARTAMLASRARLETAEMFVRMGRPETAVQLLDSVVRTYQTDVLRDRALFRIGTLYEEQLGDRDRARDTYERLLALFPNSLFADEARRRARLLRSDPS